MNDLEQHIHEKYEERAGMLEYCAGIPREKAEALARAEVDSYRLHRENTAKDSGAQR